MNSLKKAQHYLAEISKQVEDLDAEEKLHFLIELGREVPEFPKEYETTENRVPGCISDAYAIAREENGKLFFQAVAHAAVSQGFVTILLNTLNGLTKEEILEKIEPIIDDFLKKSQINASMVPSRMNAFGNVFRFMQKKVRTTGFEPAKGKATRP